MRFTLATSIVALAVLTAAMPHPPAKNTGMAIPITKRAGLVNPDKSVNVEALNDHVASTRAKFLRGLDNFERNTGNPHPAVEARNYGTGATPLTELELLLWQGNISVGTPPKNFIVAVETDFSDFFLPGSDCQSNCTGHTLYDPSNSTSSHDLGEAFNMSFGDFTTVSGELYSETVSVGGLTAEHQVLGIAASYSYSLNKYNYPPDGLLGMGFQSTSAYNATPFFQTLVSQGQVDNPVFSFKLTPNESELYLGGVNSALYTGEFTYLPVTREGYWQVQLDGVEANGQTILSDISSIIATGSAYVFGSPAQVKTLHDALGATDAAHIVGPGFYTFPCDSIPSVNFTFGGTTFTISPEALNAGQLPSNLNCISGIVGDDIIARSTWIIGDVFLQNVYSTFDIENLRVGFAKLA